jgi:methyl-CpG-binding domain protein 4
VSPLTADPDPSRIAQKLKNMKDSVTFQDNTLVSRGKSKKSSKSVSRSAKRKAKRESVNDYSDRDDVLTAVKITKCKKPKRTQYFSKKYKRLPRLGFKSSRHRHLSYPNFKPLQSPFGLIQEELHNNPWQLLIATIFLNRTTGVAAIPVLREFLKMFPNPTSVLTGDTQPTIAELMKPLGLYHKRADIIYKFSKDFVTKDWEYPEELFGIGKYGNDSYRIFCCGAEWLKVSPTDHMLNKYYDWLKQEYQNGSFVMDETWHSLERSV